VMFYGEDFNPKARASLEWTKDQLNSTEFDRTENYDMWNFLGTMQQVVEDEDVMYTHGSPRVPTREYVVPNDIRNRDKMGGIFDLMKRVCFIGHSHVPHIYTSDMKHASPDALGGAIDLRKLGDRKVLINVGSVGQPRDGDPRLSYATFDGNIVRIPNALVFKTTLTNYTTDSRRRFNFTVGVGYDVDLRLAIQTGIEVIAGTDGVMPDPGPVGVITNLGDSSITLQLFGWVDQESHSFSKVRSFAMQRVKSRFDELDIDMPEPSYKIKIESGSKAIHGPDTEKPERTPTPPSTLTSSEQLAPQSMAPDQTVIEMAESDSEDTENLLDGDARSE